MKVLVWAHNEVALNLTTVPPMKSEARQVAILRHPQSLLPVGKLYLWNTGEVDPLWLGDEVADAIAEPLPCESNVWANWTLGLSTVPERWVGLDSMIIFGCTIAHHQERADIDANCTSQYNHLDHINPAFAALDSSNERLMALEFYRELCLSKSGRLLKWSQKTGQSAKVYPKPLKGYGNGETPEVYRSV